MEALLSLMLVCAQNKGSSPGGRSSQIQTTRQGQPPCLHKPCHTRALHRADQAGIWRKEAQPKQGWLQYIRGSVREVRTCSYHMHMAVSKEEGRGQCWARRC